MIKSKVRKVFVMIAVVVVLMIGVLYLALYLPMKKYLDQTPKITPKSQVTVQVGDTVKWQDLFDVECKGQYTMKVSTHEEYYNAVEVAKDGQSLVAKEQADKVIIYIVGRGENAESVDATTTITIE